MLASAFGLGLAPVAPGTFGALLGLAWHLVPLLAGLEGLPLRLWCFLGIGLFTGLHYWLTPWAQAYWNDDDPKHFVLDESVGYLVLPACCLHPLSLDNWKFAVAGFVVERIFDIIKPPGARYFDRKVHTASGVLLDDVIAGLYAVVVMAVVAHFRAA